MIVRFRTDLLILSPITNYFVAVQWRWLAVVNIQCFRLVNRDRNQKVVSLIWLLIVNWGSWYVQICTSRIAVDSWRNKKKERLKKRKGKENRGKSTIDF